MLIHVLRLSNFFRDVAPFRYWTLAQLPNFILAAPILVLSTQFCFHYYAANPKTAFLLTFRPWKAQAGKNDQKVENSSHFSANVKTAPSLIAHAHFTLLTTLLLLVNSHVQIALRFATPGGLPAIWWAASEVVMNSTERSGVGKEGARTAKWLITYLAVWNVVSIILYAGFYPPA